MPILSGKISELRRRIEEEQDVVQNIRQTLISEYTSSLSSVKDSTLQKELNLTVTKHVATLTKPFNTNLKKLQKDTRHLNLKRQITHIFGSLILSLILIMVAHSTVSDFNYKDADIDNFYRLSICALILSGSFFAYALYRIWTLICIVVDHNNSDKNESSHNTNESNIIGSDKLKNIR